MRMKHLTVAALDIIAVCSCTQRQKTIRFATPISLSTNV